MSGPRSLRRVVMLIQNDWKTDTRVIREANALAQAGFDVHVICRRIADEEVTETENGVVYHVIPVSVEPTPIEILRLLRLHARILALRDRRSNRLTPPLPTAAFTVAPLGACLVVVRALMRSRMLRARLVTLENLLLQAIVLRLQPYRYLNDFALTCMPRLVDLKPDVIHAHDLVTMSAAALTRERVRARWIYDAHELETHTNYVLAPATKKAIVQYEAILARRADGVVTVCDSIADWLEAHYAIRRPFVVMNAPASGPASAEFDRGVRSAAGLDRSVELAVYVGSVTIDRGLELCVEALSLLPGVHLATVGPRYAVTEAAMYERAAVHGVSERLHFIDPRPADEIVAFISTADCSVMPIQNVCLSYYYCFPNKLLESVFAGLPVVVADLFELRRFVETYGVGVVVNERSAEDIAHGIRRVLDDSSYRPAAALRAEVATSYGWPRQRENLFRMYEEIADSKG